VWRISYSGIRRRWAARKPTSPALSRWLVARGDDVTVFTTTAVDLDAFWSPGRRCVRPGVSREDGVTVRRYRLVRLPLLQKYVLKALSFIPQRALQLWTTSCNPLARHGVGMRCGCRNASTSFTRPRSLTAGRWACATSAGTQRQGIPLVLTPVPAPRRSG